MLLIDSPKAAVFEVENIPLAVTVREPFESCPPTQLSEGMTF